MSGAIYERNLSALPCLIVIAVSAINVYAADLAYDCASQAAYAYG